MSKEMLINVAEGEECRIALVEDGRLEELYMERTSSTSHVGNIYKGKVTNVEPSIQAAFIDFGLGRNGFLHISDLMPTYFGRIGEDMQESVGRKMARRDRPPIQKCLRRGDEIIVQIIKEGIGTKGPTLSTYISIPGRILVMMPGMAKNGVSRKIEDDQERRRLRQILDGLKPPKDCGFIVRTAGVGKTKLEIERDLKYLTRLWENIKKKRDSGPGPVELYAEGDLVTRTVRDVFTTDVGQITVDNAEVAEKIREFFKIAMPRTKNRVELYQDSIPLFHKYGIEREIELMYSRHVPLPSGGSLVIDSTEAIVAIDVNSGKFRDHNDAETTAFKTDMEAADEIPRQLRLRDLGGVIICDFIDLRFERHRHELEKRLDDNLRHDRAKTKMLRMSQFGIIEMTRQRMRPSLKRSIYFDCPHCKGAGLVKTPESMGLDVMRRLAIAVGDGRVERIQLAVCADVAFVLQNKKRRQLAELEDRFGKKIVVRAEPTLGMDELKLELHDARDGLVFIDELGMTPQQPVQQASNRPHHTQQQPPRRGQRDDGRPRPGGRDQGRNQQGRSGGGRQQRGRDDMDADQDDRYDMERVEDAVEEREEHLDESMDVSPERMDDERGHDEEMGEDAGHAEQGEDDHDDRPVPQGRDQNQGRPPQGHEQRGRDQQGRDQQGRNQQARDQQARDIRGQRDRDNRAPQGRDIQGQRGRDIRGQQGRDIRGQQGRNNQAPRGRDIQGQQIRDQQARERQQAPIQGRGNQGGGKQGGGNQDNRGGRQEPIQGRGGNDQDNRNRQGAVQNRGGVPDNHGPENRDQEGGGEGEGGGRRRRRRRRGRGGRGRFEDQQRPNETQPNDASNSEFVNGPESTDEGRDDQSENIGQRPEEDGYRAAEREPEEVFEQRAIVDEAVVTEEVHELGDNLGNRAGVNTGGEPEPEAEVEAAPKKKRAQARGGTGRARAPRKAKKTPAAETAKVEAKEAPSKPAPTPRKSAAPKLPAIVRTGSTDRHLINDEPVDPQPVSRPRTYRDLDSIPDDLD